MKAHRRTLLSTPIIILALSLFAPPADAGGSDWFGVHFGSGGFGVAIGHGNWSVYGDCWHDSHWSIDYNVALSGYGEWVYVSGLGQVWRPYVATGWRPYTHGRWVYTGIGWTWVSYEPWGYFPHHYGHWAHTGFGWVWQPGYTYHPGNVVWVHSGSHVGWYACPPHGWSHASRGFWHGYKHGHHDGYHQGFNNGYDRGYGDGYWDGWRDARYATFVERRHLTSDNISRHSLPAQRVNRLANAASVRRAQAPHRSEVRSWTGHRVQEHQVERRQVNIGDRSMTMARPRGIERSVERNAGDTVDRALSQDLSQRFKESRGNISQVRPTSRSTSTQSPERRINTSSRDTVISTSRGRLSNDRLSNDRKPVSVEGRSSSSPRTSTLPKSSSSYRSRGTTPSRSSTTPDRSSYSSRTRSAGDRNPAPATVNRSLPSRSSSSSTKSTASSRPSMSSPSQRSTQPRSYTSGSSTSRSDRARSTAINSNRSSGSSNRSSAAVSSNRSPRSTRSTTVNSDRSSSSNRGRVTPSSASSSSQSNGRKAKQINKKESSKKRSDSSRRSRR
jgi:hypothetical protein